MVTNLRNGWSGARIPAGTRDLFSLPQKLPYRLWGPPSLPLNGYFFFFFLLDVKLLGHEVAYFHLVPRSGMNRAVPLLLLYNFIAFFCRSYCLLNMFRAPLCPSSGAQEYYTVVAACGIWRCGFQVVGLVWS